MANDFKQFMKDQQKANEEARKNLLEEQQHEEFMATEQGKRFLAERRNTERNRKQIKKRVNEEQEAYDKAERKLENYNSQIKDLEEKLGGIAKREERQVDVQEKRLKNMKKAVSDLEKYENLGGQLKDSLFKPFQSFASKIPEPLRILGKMGIGGIVRWNARRKLTPPGVKGPQEGQTEEQKREEISRNKSSVKNAKETVKAIKKGNKQDNENWKKQGIANKRLLLVTAAAGVFGGAMKFLGGAVGIIGTVLGKFLLPIIAGLGLGGIGKILVDKLMAWITGQEAPDISESLTNMSGGEALLYGGGGIASVVAARRLLRRRRKRGGQGGCQSKKSDRLRLQGGTDVGNKGQFATKEQIKAEKKLLRTQRRIARATVTANALTSSLTAAQTGVQNAANQVKPKKQAQSAAKKLAKKGMKKAALKTAAVAALAIPFVGPFIAAGATLAFIGMDAYDGWNNAAQILGKKEATTGEKIKVSVASVVSGLTFGLWSTKSVLGTMDAIGDYFDKTNSDMQAKIDKRKRNTKALQDAIKAMQLQTDNTAEGAAKILALTNALKKVAGGGPASVFGSTQEAIKTTLNAVGANEGNIRYLDQTLDEDYAGRRPTAAAAAKTIKKQDRMSKMDLLAKLRLGLTSKVIRKSKNPMEARIAAQKFKSSKKLQDDQIMPLIKAILASGLLEQSYINENLKTTIRALGLGGKDAPVFATNYDSKDQSKKTVIIGTGNAAKRGHSNMRKR